MNFRHLLFSAIISISLISPAFGAKHANAYIRYDGVYKGTPEILENYDETTTCKYLRFYPDGTAITVSTECDESDGALKEFKTWFHRGHKDMSKGKFTIHEGAISFSSVSRAGTVDYSGEASYTTMHLTTFSHINQYKNTDSYVFIKW